MSVTTFSLFFAMLTVVANAGVVVLVFLGLRTRGGRAPHLRARLQGFLEANGLLIAWLVALVATGGSLYYSEVAGYTPCELCWYQRIAMYPLSVVLGIAYFTRDVWVKRYVIPVVAIGGSISIFHYIIQRFPDLISASCDPAAPCTVTWVWQFHYISIPFMALSGFALIATLLVLTRATGSVEGAPDDDLD